MNSLAVERRPAYPIVLAWRRCSLPECRREFPAHTANAMYCSRAHAVRAANRAWYARKRGGSVRVYRRRAS